MNHPLLSTLNGIEGKIIPLEAQLRTLRARQVQTEGVYRKAVIRRDKAEESKFGRALCDISKAIGETRNLLAPLRRQYSWHQGVMQGKIALTA